MRILLVTPAKPGSRHGNRNTAVRWARLLRELGHRVVITVDFDAPAMGQRFDLLLALHARRSHAALRDWKAAFPAKPAILALTGTDLYRDIHADAKAQTSLELADRMIVLQSEGLKELNAKQRRRTRVIHQSVDPVKPALPPKTTSLITVIGHLREEKDPFRAALALRHLDPALPIRVVQLGGAMSAAMERQAYRLMAEEPRYRWLGELSHGATMRWLARSHLMVISSRMEGGAHVVSEAIEAGVPVLASRISGNIGLLGRDYSGYYRLEDDKALARLMKRCVGENADDGFLGHLCAQVVARRPLIARDSERSALRILLEEVRQ